MNAESDLQKIESDLQKREKENKTIKRRIFFTPLVVFMILTFFSVVIAGATKVAPLGIPALIIFSIMWSKISIKYESYWRGSFICLFWYLLLSIVFHSVMFNSYVENLSERYITSADSTVSYSVLVWIFSKITYTIPLLFVSCLIARKISGVKDFEIASNPNKNPTAKNRVLWFLSGALSIVLITGGLLFWGINEIAGSISSMMGEGRSEAEIEFEKGMKYYQASDAVQSVYWFTKSAKHLHKPAFRQLIEMYSTGDLVEKDLITAGAFANMLTMLISTQEEADYVKNIHSMALETKVEGGANPHFEIKKKRNEIWDNDEWAGN